MTVELREALAGVEDAVAAKLAANDIVDLSDAELLTAADLDGLGFTLGVRNKILKAVQPTTERAVAEWTGSVKNLLSSVFAGGDGAPPELGSLLSVLKPFESKADQKSIESRRKLWRAGAHTRAVHPHAPPPSCARFSLWRGWCASQVARVGHKRQRPPVAGGGGQGREGRAHE